MTFTEAHELWLFEKMVEDGEICTHGWPPDKCECWTYVDENKHESNNGDDYDDED